MPLVGGSPNYIKAKAGSTTGPASYATGGFVVDLSADFSSVDFFQLAIETVGANLPPCHFEVTRNSPTNGKVTVKVMRHRYDRATVPQGGVGNAPTGVTVQTSKQNSDGESGHTHDTTIGALGTTNKTSGAPSATAAPTAGIASAPGTNTHTHTTDIDHTHGTKTSAAGTSHNHGSSFLYDHSHTVTQTETNAASVELGAGTNLSGTTLRWFAFAN
jgi:hypothetical protein